ncbi:MAG TPA: HlyD family secretion protein [Nitrospira sp.]|nr:HlyD family secretion protein [Nitrospira sp.]
MAVQPVERIPAREIPSADKKTEVPHEPRRQPWYRRPAILAGVILLASAAVAFGIRLYLHARAYESTDDAFIQADVVPVSPKVASYVVAVHVDDNQHVKRGDLLVELDARDFEAALAQARADLAADQTELLRARQEADRLRRLVPEQAVAMQDVDNAIAAERAAVAHVAQAEAAVRQRELDLSYTKILSPETGRITRKRVEPGAYVQVGQTLFSIVPDDVWVVANFKETQLSQMRVGQPVLIHVDAYPGLVFHGHVDSIQAGSGAAFSLLPPENATGNYVKVVQRVPVKIVFDEPADGVHVLGPGMSVVPEVRVR